ncbi:MULTISPECIES: DUF2635 domain-containing protein [Pantoea]|uniref:DUF2635 domain-containing protein n=1 Tax=Pantoea TaxID=53335 RepID=UPI000BB59F51|nr:MULTISPECIES: DUF2635 domain-containing protein [Pantoea]PNK64448.1 DUF2635 domain-containing protein [Pantoea sp. FDAARGOS_194]POW56591.1 DUF2635 domain-containing protein [Pantoea alvi]
MQIKPKRGRSVPDPARGDLLPSEGRNVEESSYWLRRLAAGDVEKVAPEEKKAVADTKKQGGE